MKKFVIPRFALDIIESLIMAGLIIVSLIMSGGIVIR